MRNRGSGEDPRLQTTEESAISRTKSQRRATCEIEAREGTSQEFGRLGGVGGVGLEFRNQPDGKERVSVRLRGGGRVECG